MTDTKRCPACSGEVPVLAVRCKFCGVRLDPPIEALSDGPELSPPGEPSMIADLDDFDLASDLDFDDDVSNDHLSAPPPSREGIPSAPPPAPKSSVPPPRMNEASLPPAPPLSAPPPPLPLSAPPLPPLAMSTSTPPPLAPISSAPPAPAERSVPPMAMTPPGPSAPPPMATPAGSSIPPMATPQSAPVSSPPAAAAAIPAPGSPKRTMLGMAPVQFPGEPPSMMSEKAEAAPIETMESLVGKSAGPGSLLSAESSLLGDDDLDALDLDDDLLDDELEEISKFTEQTAITDVSTLAQGMSDDVEVDDDDLPADLLDDILDESDVGGPQEITDATLEMSPAAVPVPMVPGPRLPEPSGPVPVPHMPFPVAVPMMETPEHIPAARRQGINPVVYGFVAMVALLAVGGVAFMVLSGGDEAEDNETKMAGNAAGTPASPSPSGGEKSDNMAEHPENTTKRAADDTIDSASNATHKCKSFADYPGFPWKDKLATLVTGLDKSSLCGLFGVSKEDIATALKNTPSLGPTGYDLLPNASVFEVFPLGKAQRRAPTIEYVFVEDTLFEIRLKYQMDSAKALDTDVFSGALGAPKRTRKDPAGREIRRYKDGDMLVEWFQRTDAYKRVFNEIVFASVIRRDAIKDFAAKREKAIVAFAQGMAYFNKKEPMRAIDKFKKARELIPEMGMAYIFEGITALQSEDFSGAEKAARKALERSSDDRAKAGAKGLLAVAALYKGNKAEAEELFKTASTLDPTDPEFSTSLNELKSGNYDASRVAKTAARMSCKRENPTWTTKGLLARGNFPDNAAFVAAKRNVRQAKDYKGAYDMWVSWECN